MTTHRQMPIALQTQLPLGECKARLAANIDLPRRAFTRSGHAGSRDILGKVCETTFHLEKRRYYRNSFAPVFFGELTPYDGGTRIAGKFRMRPFTKYFMILWFSFVGLFTLQALLSLLAQPTPDPLARLLPVGMAIFGFILVKFSGWLARNEKVAIISFIKSTLEADLPSSYRK